VRFRLVPRDEEFFSLFDQAAENLAGAAKRFRDVLDDLDGASAGHERVKEFEHAGDEILRSIMVRLNSTFVTPFDREDIHALATQMDDVVDDIQAAAELLVLHDVDKPLPEMVELTDLLVEISSGAVGLVAKLSRLRGVDEELRLIDRLESDADKVYRRGVARLFSGEFDAFDVLKLKDIIEAIEEAVNGVENIADIVESIVLKHA
jgi:uncharacterized protein